MDDGAGENGEKANAFEGTHHSEGAEQTGEGLEVKIFEILLVRCDQEGCGKCQYRRDDKNGIALDKVLDFRHKFLTNDKIQPIQYIPKSKKVKSFLKFSRKFRQGEKNKSRQWMAGHFLCSCFCICRITV